MNWINMFFNRLFSDSALQNTYLRGKVLENEEEVKKYLIFFSSNTEMLLALMATSFFNEVLFHHHDCESKPIEYKNAYLALFK